MENEEDVLTGDVMNLLQIAKRLVLGLGVFLTFEAFPHASASLHHNDISNYLGGYDKTPLGDIYRRVSNYHDSESARWFRERFGGIPGNHRLVEHGAALGEAIPEKSLETLRQEMLRSKGFKEKFFERTGRVFTEKEAEWVLNEYKIHHAKKAAEFQSEFKALGLPSREATAELVNASNTHFLSDLTSDNTLIQSVKEFDDICKSEISAYEVKFGKEYPGYFDKVKRDILAIQRCSLSVKEKADALTIYRSRMKVDLALKKTRGGTLAKEIRDAAGNIVKKPVVWDPVADVNRNARVASPNLIPNRKTSKGVQKILDEIFLRRAQTGLDAPNKMGRMAIQGANVREVVVNGKRLKAVDVPVVTENGKMEVATEFLRKNPAKASALKNGLKTTGKQTAKGTVVKGSANISKWLATSAGQGVSAGVLSFVFHEGESIVAYSNGTMESDEFVRRSAFNAGLAVTEGTAVYLITGAMAGAPAALTLGAVVVAGIVIEQAGEYVWYQIDREVGTFPGITVDELFFAVDEEVRNRRTVLDDLNDREKGKPSAAPIPYSNL